MTSIFISSVSSFGASQLATCLPQWRRRRRRAFVELSESFQRAFKELSESFRRAFVEPAFGELLESFRGAVRELSESFRRAFGGLLQACKKRTY